VAGSNYVVIRSEFIATRQEAVDYYAARIAGVRALNCRGQALTVVFPGDGAHLYSEGFKGDPTTLAPAEKVVRRVAGGRIEVRRFSLVRAVALDLLQRTVEHYGFAIAGDGNDGREKVMLHSHPLPSGGRLRVVLRPGPGSHWTFVSAYEVNRAAWLQLAQAKRLPFPPD